MCSLPVVTNPVLVPSSESPALDPVKTMIEHLVASMARVEARMDEFDRRPSSSRHPNRPDPEPPYTRYDSRPLDVSLPFIPPFSAVSVAVPSLPLSASAPFLGFHEGFHHNPSGPPGSLRPPMGPRFPHQEQHSSWDIPATSRMTSAWDPWGSRFTEQQSQGRGSTWDLPSQRHTGNPQFMDKAAGVTMKPPRLDGSNVVSWISRVQFYFDHFSLPEDHRLHYAVMLFEPPVAEWVFNYREGNPTARWTDFLEDVRRRVDPKCFVDYFGVLAKLCQTGSLADYNTEFEGMLNRVRGVPDRRLVTLYVEGLQQPIRNQVKFQYPPSVAAAIALALEFDAAVDKQPSQPTFQRRAWQPRENRQRPGSQPTPHHSGPQPQIASETASGRSNQAISKGADFAGLPVMRLTAAQKADRTRRNLCWYCPEKYVPGHVCNKPFLAYMRVDEDDTTLLEEEPPSEEIITTDLSHIYAMKGKPRSDYMTLQGLIEHEPVQILVDTGSSHDFLHPRIVEKLKLPLTAVRPFPVYVGNGASLVCSFASVATELRIQQETFKVILHILPVHGLDVVLGLTWLRSLRRVTNLSKVQ